MSDGPIVFDIETGPLPEPDLSDAIARIFVPPKTGRTKDEEKLKEKFDEARLKLRDRAALNPMTGRVLAIGYYSPSGKSGKAMQVIDVISEGGDPAAPERTESDLITQLWSVVLKGRPMLGWNIKGFDLPFLLKRSAALSVDVPREVIQGRYWSQQFVDVMTDRWCVGDSEKFASLDSVSQMCGLSGKFGGIDGSQFSEMFLGGKELRQQAIAYLERDIVLPWEIAVRTGY